ncbi:AMP-binding protein [Streptosporangium amethystogenes subsp. fukuiense]|uniref:AMP-binding protein n=1 Tax=Streptosporangium amethystogenes TaxID=2002 RepID=UPI00361BEAD2
MPGAAATIASAFAERARRAPDAEAVVGDGFSLSYAELDGRANRLAHRLIGLGVRPETPVAVLLDRSADVVVTTLAIAKAGGAYVPIHHGYPPDRMSWVMADTGAPVLVTDRSPGFEHAAQVVRVDEPVPADPAPPEPRSRFTPSISRTSSTPRVRREHRRGSRCGSATSWPWPRIAGGNGTGGC